MLIRKCFFFIEGFPYRHCISITFDYCLKNKYKYNRLLQILALSVDTALGRDVTRLPVPASIIPVLPLADAGWAVSSVNTTVGTNVTYRHTSTPGAVTITVQRVVITLPVDWRPPVHLLASGHIAAKMVWPRISCSGGGQCD